MPKWEYATYLVIWVEMDEPEGRHAHFLDLLNDHGYDGWELVSLLPAPEMERAYRSVWKRPISDRLAEKESDERFIRAERRVKERKERKEKEEK